MAHEEPILPTPRAATVEDYRAVLKQARDFISFLKGDEYTVAGHCIDQLLAMPNPAPQTHVVASDSPWQWWAGESEEWCTVGPEATKEAIIQAAINDTIGEFQDEEGTWKLSFHIVEARQDPLRLADWIESDRLLERAEESMADSDRTSSEYDDGPWFECTPEQERDLEERVKRACDEWQIAHGLTFSCSTFSHTRNQEIVVVDHPQNDTLDTEDKANG